MKLIYCPYCEDLFRLTLKPRRCDCSRVGGYYLSEREAVVSGRAISVAFGNGSFQQAVSALGRERERPLGREGWQSENRFLAWVRPSEGAGNPHTTVVPLEEIKS